MKSSSLLIFFLLSFFLTTLCNSSSSTGAPRRELVLVGGWSPIENLADPHVVQLANFAVSEHNKKANSKVGLSRVVRGETQVVTGIIYRLVVEAKDGGSYEAVVWEKAWEKFLELTSFKPL